MGNGQIANAKSPTICFTPGCLPLTRFAVIDALQRLIESAIAIDGTHVVRFPSLITSLLPSEDGRERLIGRLDLRAREFRRPLLDLLHECRFSHVLANCIGVESLRFEITVHRRVQERLDRSDRGVKRGFDVVKTMRFGAAMRSVIAWTSDEKWLPYRVSFHPLTFMLVAGEVGGT